MSDDPFEDRGEDDPFEDLEGDVPGEDRSDTEHSEESEHASGTGDASDAWAEDETSLFTDAVDTTDAGESPQSDDSPGTDSPDPFTDLAAEAGDAARSESPETDESDPFEGFERPEEDPFADFESGGEGLDDTVWDDLSVDADADSLADQREGRKVSEVSKHRFCEQCPHFTGPPEIRCTHEGTEIQEFLDMETVRVVDCPVVEEREAMGDLQ